MPVVMISMLRPISSEQVAAPVFKYSDEVIYNELLFRGNSTKLIQYS